MIFHHQMDPMPPLQAPIGTNAATTPGTMPGFPPGGPLGGAFSNPPPAAPQFPLLSGVGLGGMNNSGHGKYMIMHRDEAVGLF